MSLEFGQGIRKITVVVNCAQPGELVRIDIIANVAGSEANESVGTASARQLGMFRADEHGVARGTVSLPQNAACDATIKATGLESKRVAYSDIYIEPCNKDAGAASTPDRPVQSAGERSVTVNPGAASSRVAPAAEANDVQEIKSATKAREVHEATAPRTISLAGSDSELIDEAVRIDPELLAMSSDTAGPLNPISAAAGLGLLLAGVGGGAFVARRRAGSNHY